MIKYVKKYMLLILVLLLFLSWKPSDSKAADILSHANTTQSIFKKTIPVWRVLFLVFHQTNVNYIDEFGSEQHLVTSLSDFEIQQATQAFLQYQSLAHQYSEGEAVIQYDIVHISDPIISVSPLGDDGYWVSPNDIRHKIDQYAPPGKYDSILVHWAQCDQDFSQCIPSFGWGWASTVRGMTYAVVANAQNWAWETPTIGEPWLHEWLHAVCWYYQSKGYPMPENDADGASGHGYDWSPTDGWMAYYHDLMTGNVLEGDRLTGITANAWQSGTIFQHSGQILADFYYSNTLAEYETKGVINWDSGGEQILMGGEPFTESHLYTQILTENSLTASGRVFIPNKELGRYDSIALAMRDENHEFWGLLAYGTDLNEKDHISILHNDIWGDLYPLKLSSGWYTVKLYYDNILSQIHLKVWADGKNEPEWQITQNVPQDWLPTTVGFRHYGDVVANVDGLFATIHPKEVFLPLIISN